VNVKAIGDEKLLNPFPKIALVVHEQNGFGCRRRLHRSVQS